MGADHEELILVAAEIAKDLPHRTKVSKLSEGKKYASLHVEIEVDSEAERNRLFDLFKKHPKVKFVL